MKTENVLHNKADPFVMTLIKQIAVRIQFISGLYQNVHFRYGVSTVLILRIFNINYFIMYNYTYIYTTSYVKAQFK